MIDNGQLKVFYLSKNDFVAFTTNSQLSIFNCQLKTTHYILNVSPSRAISVFSKIAFASANSGSLSLYRDEK